MTNNPWKSVQRALTALTSLGKAKLEKLKHAARNKSSLKLSREQEQMLRNFRQSKCSSQFQNSKIGTPGRRATRWLDDEAVSRASIKSRDPKHQAKFLGRGQRKLLVLQKLVTQ